ncbi:zinc knuckle CX2CX4HX4C containing protein [Tanacetum coccineum]
MGTGPSPNLVMAEQAVSDRIYLGWLMNTVDMVNPTISSISGNASGCNKFTIEDVESKFEVSLKSKVEIEAFANGLEAGTYPKWFLLSNDVKDIFTELVCKRHTELSSLKNSNQVPSASDTFVEVVKKVESRLEHTLYGYFLGQRLAFPVVEYFAKTNWAKHGLKRIMMNNKGFFFFKFESRAGLDTVLEGGPWLIRKTPIILKTWTVGTRLLKEEMSCIPVWVKFHDVPIQAFEEEDFTKETIRVEYEWKPPRCDTCKIFGHTIDHCPLNVGFATNVNTYNIVNPPMESVNDGFQKVTKKKKNRGKSKSAAGYKMVGPTMRYEPKAPKNDLKKIPPLSAASGSAHQNNTSNVDYVGKSSSDVQQVTKHSFIFPHF